MWSREGIAGRAARELPAGSYVNLGIGLPTLIPKFIEPSQYIVLHSENGVLGVGRPAAADEVDADLIDAGKQPITMVTGTSFFDSATSFAMIRGGKIDVAVLGALQVSATGDLANWAVPGRMVRGIGGAMDLVAGARRVIVLMDHVTRSGEPKILQECDYPTTGVGVVDTVITDLCVMSLGENGVVVRELAPGVTADDVRGQTGAPVTFELAPIVVP